MEFNITLIIGGVFTWIIVILGIARFAKFYVDFKKMEKKMDANMENLATILKKINSASLETLFEQRQNNKLMAEFVKKFADVEVEVVEEPIPPEEAPSNGKPQNFVN